MMREKSAEGDQGKVRRDAEAWAPYTYTHTARAGRLGVLMKDFLVSAFESAQIPMIICRQAEGYPVALVNEAARRLTGLAAEGPGRLAEVLRLEEGRGAEALAGLPKGGTETNRLSAELLRPDGRWDWVSVAANRVEWAGDNYVALYLGEAAQAELERSLQALRTVSDSVGDVLYVNDIYTYETLFLNRAMESALGRPAGPLPGGPCWKLLQRSATGPCSFCPMPTMIADGYLTDGRAYSWEYQNADTQRWYLVKDSFIKWIDGRTVHLATATDITTLKQYEEQLKYYAATDTMTGAYNREWGNKIIEEMLSSATITEGEVSLVFMDLDDLKKTNDAYGHNAGDDALRQIARIARACIRKSDIICRWGGDEFILLLRCGLNVAEGIMKKLEEQVEAYNQESGKPYRINFSYGITRLKTQAKTNVEAIVTQADKLMYQHKMSKEA